MPRIPLAVAALLVLAGCAPASFAPTAPAPETIEPTGVATSASATPTPGPSRTASPSRPPSAAPTTTAPSPTVDTLLIPDPSPNEIARLSFGPQAGFEGVGPVLPGAYTVEVACAGPHELGYRISLDGAVVAEGAFGCYGTTNNYVEAFEAQGGEELEIAQVGDYPTSNPGYIRVLHNG